MSKIHAEVLNVAIKAKKVKERGEDGTVFESVQRVGRMTIEFDGETTDIGELQKFVHGRYISLVIDDPRYRMES